MSNRHAITPSSNEELRAIHQQLIYRHIAWFTALRYQLRQPGEWENMDKVYNIEYRKFFKVPEYEEPIESLITKYLSSEEWSHIQKTKNQAAQILALQSADIKTLLENGFIEDFRHVEMQGIISPLFENQRMCERIKNFPYHKQFAALNLYFVWLFILLLPFGMMNEFSKLRDHMTWLTLLSPHWFHGYSIQWKRSENTLKIHIGEVPTIFPWQLYRAALKSICGKCYTKPRFRNPFSPLTEF